MKAIITGGGTGGHIYPALAVLRALENKGWDILYIGSRGGLEGNIIPAEGIKFREVNVAPLPRKLSLKLISSPIKTAVGFYQARKIIKGFKPDIVLGTGGFVAGPVVLAAAMLKIPSVIQEQNVYPGFTNKMLARWVNAIALNFAEARKYFPENIKAEYRVTGNPIRKVILDTDRKSGMKQLSLDANRKTILVFGGSQGAMSINKAMIDVYRHFQDNNRIQIIHITGKKNYNTILDEIRKEGININKSGHYKIKSYITHMEYAYAVADLVVYRAGATGIAEITAKGIPAILIPYPFAAENHQEYNARNLEKHGAAVVILDKDLNGRKLIEKIEMLINDHKRLSEMSRNSRKLANPDAVKNIVNLIEEMV
ncbi:MAG: undecaprenyldiphospho-muramoylpentapeptide beta-N-acetylglucosaminyltransferase [Halanaerobiales bacterium]